MNLSVRKNKFNSLDLKMLSQRHVHSFWHKGEGVFFPLECRPFKFSLETFPVKYPTPKGMEDRELALQESEPLASRVT